MITYNIKIKDINNVKDFVQIVSEAPFEVNLQCRRYVVDASSIMGVLSIDISNRLELHMETNNEAEAKAVVDKLGDLIELY